MLRGLGRREFRWPAVSDEVIVNRARILVIDDQDFPYKKLFVAGGYTLEKWTTIKQLEALERRRFDLILLDLQGVGREHTEEEGLGVLRYIKEVSPAQMVIAYSNAEFPLEYQPFFDQADSVMAKTADYLDFKREVDRLLREKFSEAFYLRRIREELARSGTLAPTRLDREFRRGLSAGDFVGLQRALESAGSQTPTTDRVLNIAQVALALVQVLQVA